VLALLLTLSSFAPAAPALRAQQAPVQGVDVSGATAEARALWERVRAASGDAQREPLRAFQFQAEVRARSGVQRNDAKIDLGYLAPDCIRFLLASGNETGRFGAAPEQYWMQTKECAVVLAGREYKEDRKAVDDMLALVRNYVALSNPARLNLMGLELLPAAPADLGKGLAGRFKKLRWLALESSDFALLRSEIAREAPVVYRVELGLREDALPAVAIVRERGKATTDPLLVEFSEYREQDAFKLPFQLRVYPLDRTQVPPAFAEEAAQEVYVTTAVLRPALKVADFQPRK
jgi:hypothetical protein